MSALIRSCSEADGLASPACRTLSRSTFSKSAREKIESAGGSVSWIGGEPVAKADLPPSKKQLKVAAAAEQTRTKAAAAESGKNKNSGPESKGAESEEEA